MLNNTRGIVVLALAALMAASPVQAGLFSSRFDDFKELVEAGKIEEAAAFYASEPDYFSELKGDKRKYADEIMGQRDRRYRAELGEVRARLLLAEREEGQIRRWKQLKTSLPETEALLTRLRALPAQGPLTVEGVAQLSAAASRIGQALEAQAPQALLDHGLFSEPSFAALYPVAPRWRDATALAAPVEQQLAAASARQLAVFRKTYGTTLVPALGLTGKLNAAYLAARVRESGATSYFVKRLLSERVAKEGWPQTGKSGEGVLLAAWPAPETETSPYRVAAPTAVAIKLMDAEKTPGEFVAAGGAQGYELVVFLRSTPPEVERVESQVRQVGSQYQSGVRRVRNPAYADAVNELRAAEAQLADVQRTVANSSSNAGSTLGALTAMVGAATQIAAENRVSSAQSQLAETPQIVDEAVMAPYSYTAKTVAVKQTVTIHYAVYDAGTGKVSTGSVDRVNSKQFEVADGVRADDPGSERILRSASTSQAIEAWIGGPINDKYDAVWKAVLADCQQRILGI